MSSSTIVIIVKCDSSLWRSAPDHESAQLLLPANQIVIPSHNCKTKCEINAKLESFHKTLDVTICNHKNTSAKLCHLAMSQGTPSMQSLQQRLQSGLDCMKIYLDPELQQQARGINAGLCHFCYGRVKIPRTGNMLCYQWYGIRFAKNKHDCRLGLYLSRYCCRTSSPHRCRPCSFLYTSERRSSTCFTPIFQVGILYVGQCTTVYSLWR